MTKSVYIILFSILFPCVSAQENSMENWDKIPVRIKSAQHDDSKSLSLFIHHKIRVLLMNDVIDSLSHFTNLDNQTVVTLNINVILKFGTSWWEPNDPPKKPLFFMWKLLLGKNNQKMNDRINYEKFLSLWRDRKELPYECIEKIIVIRDFWINVRDFNFKDDSWKTDFSSKGGIKKASIKYELLPDINGGLEIKQRDLVIFE